MPGADHRRHPRRLTGGGAAIAAVCDIRIATRQCADRLSHRRHPRQLPVHREFGRLAALIGPARVDRHGLHRAADRGGGGQNAVGLLSEILPRPCGAAGAAPRRCRPDAGRPHAADHARDEGGDARLRLATRQVNGDDLVTMCFTSDGFRGACKLACQAADAVEGHLMLPRRDPVAGGAAARAGPCIESPLRRRGAGSRPGRSPSGRLRPGRRHRHHRPAAWPRVAAANSARASRSRTGPAPAAPSPRWPAPAPSRMAIRCT